MVTFSEHFILKGSLIYNLYEPNFSEIRKIVVLLTLKYIETKMSVFKDNFDEYNS